MTVSAMPADSHAAVGVAGDIGEVQHGDRLTRRSRGAALRDERVRRLQAASAGSHDRRDEPVAAPCDRS